MAVRRLILPASSSSTQVWPLRTRQLLGLLLPYDQIELVALRVGERGLPDRVGDEPRADRREFGLVERPGAQAGQPLDLLVVVVGDQDQMDPLGLADIAEKHPGT